MQKLKIITPWANSVVIYNLLGSYFCFWAIYIGVMPGSTIYLTLFFLGLFGLPILFFLFLYNYQNTLIHELSFDGKFVTVVYENKFYRIYKYKYDVSKTGIRAKINIKEIYINRYQTKPRCLVVFDFVNDDGTVFSIQDCSVSLVNTIKILDFFKKFEKFQCD